jgi:signal transduction histidine kinase
VCEAEELISDLLELSRLNVEDSISQVCHIGDLLQKIIRTLKFEKDVHIQMPPQWPVVLGQENLLRQIFQNLMWNGVKFNRSTSKILELSWRREGTKFVRIFIRDNGIGILPQYQKQIFQIFQRLHTTKDYAGTGIGLAIVKKAVTKLGGEVSVESEIGKGSIFSFTVPRGEMHDE